MQVHGRAPQDTFESCIDHFPQVSVELVLEREEGYLLAKRVNEPARGEWFWPGGRLRKGEQLEAAAHRVARDELGFEVTLEGQLGVYEHFWDDIEPTQHTVNVVYLCVPADPDSEVALDDQHAEYRYITHPSEELHPYVRTYLEDIHQGKSESRPE